jgi:hypothetical protein
VPAFRENEIDWDVLPKLSAEDLKDLGVVFDCRLYTGDLRHRPVVFLARGRMLTSLKATCALARWSRS